MAAAGKEKLKARVLAGARVPLGIVKDAQVSSRPNLDALDEKND